MRLHPALLAILFLAVACPGARAQQPVEVDTELVLAVDVSRSMTARELELQRRGYAEALTSDAVIAAITQTGLGRIALRYVEWAGSDLQTVVIDWTLVAGREDAERIARRLSASPTSAMRRTSISGAIDHAAASFEGNGFEGLRRVIDISGDGPNNQGRPVTAARDDAVARGIVINGLPIMTREGVGQQWHLEDLDIYYRDCVIGGPTAFMLPVLNWDDFPQAVRNKLVFELVRRGDPVIPVDGRIMRASTPGYDCLVGEKIWRTLYDDWN